MATCEATGPVRILRVVSADPAGAPVVSISATSREVANVCTTPWLASAVARRIASGRSSPSVERTRSCQKLPMVPLVRLTRPRVSTASTQSPLAADTKFCTVSPSAWESGESVVSPAYECQLVLVVKLAAVLRAISQGTAGIPAGFPGKTACSRRMPSSRPNPAAWNTRSAAPYSPAVISRTGQLPAACSRGRSIAARHRWSSPVGASPVSLAPTRKIAAERHGINLVGMQAETIKEMSKDMPRRIAGLRTRLTIPLPADHPQRALLENAAHTCPVHKSLASEIDTTIECVWAGAKPA